MPTSRASGASTASPRTPPTPDRLFAGSASGGLWASLDGGKTWTPRTDFLPVLGVSGIAIDPHQTNVLYLATGDLDGKNTPSVGVYKSTDGGVNWSPTGLTFTDSYQYLSRVLVHPNDSARVFASGRDGIYLSTDAGVSWKKVLTGGTGSYDFWQDLKFQPGNPSVLYALKQGGGFYRSQDGGLTWTATATGLPAAGAVDRGAIAVTPADPQAVYLIIAGTNYAFNGIYRSGDAGNSFNKLAGKDADKSFGRQGFYTITLAASPTVRGELYLGGFTVGRSTDDGATWTTVRGGGTTYKPGEIVIHVDIHDLEFINGSLHACTDGGLHRTSDGGANWTDLSQGLAVAQVYGISGTEQDASLIYSAQQDDGLNRPTGDHWEHCAVGDWATSVIDPTDKNIVYGSSHGGIYKTTVGFSGFNYTRLTVTTENSQFIGAPLVMLPNDPHTLLAGFQNVFRTTDSGNTWAAISNFGDSNTCLALSVAASDSRVIYVSRSKSGGQFLLRSNDGGATWTDVSAGLPANTQVTAITISPTEWGHVWVTLRGGTKQVVYTSTNGGGAWTNYTGSLPDLTANTIVYENGSKDRVYVGLSSGVYYRDAGMSDWAAFKTNLPNVIVNDLKIHYGTRRLRAGTFGRGVWETSLAGATSPVPAFFAGAADVGGGFFYLPFFGYYNPANYPYIFHNDLGFLYAIDANDGRGGVYFYDFGTSRGSLGFFYTSPSFPFPYLYDFKLNAFLYYFPDTARSAGFFTTNPRVFVRLDNGQFLFY